MISPDSDMSHLGALASEINKYLLGIMKTLFTGGSKKDKQDLVSCPKEVHELEEKLRHMIIITYRQKEKKRSRNQT